MTLKPISSNIIASVKRFCGIKQDSYGLMLKIGFADGTITDTNILVGDSEKKLKP